MLQKFFLTSDWSSQCFNLCLLPPGLSLCSSGKSLLLVSKLLLAYCILQCCNHPRGLCSSWLVCISSTRSAAFPAHNPLIWARGCRVAPLSAALVRSRCTRSRSFPYPRCHHLITAGSRVAQTQSAHAGSLLAVPSSPTLRPVAGKSFGEGLVPTSPSTERRLTAL